MSSNIEDKLANFKSHLIMIKSLKQSQQQEQFYLLLEKAKQTLGDVSPYMANFYLEYGSFLLEKIEKSMDMLNAAAVPEAQRQQQFQQIQEVFEDESQQLQNGANLEKVQKQIEKQQKVVYENGDVKITQDNDQQIKMISSKPKEQVSSQNQQQPKQQQQQKLDDIQIAYENFQAALNIYLQQKNKIEQGQSSVIHKQQIDRNIIVLHRRLGNLYMVDQHYIDAIDQYRAVIKLQSEKQGSAYNRKISQAHYNIGNCLLHDNKQNCQKLAIKQYIQSIKILVKNMQIEMEYDTLAFQLPNENKIKVDRFAYLNKPSDSQKVKQTKQVILLLLDKIQDTYEQIGQRKSYQAEKLKMNQAKQQNTFKQVSKDVKVTNLGTFGNRKKVPTPIQQSLKLNFGVLKQNQKDNPTGAKINTSENIQTQKPVQISEEPKPNQNTN